MKLTIERDILAVALQRVTPLIGRATIPILACVKLSASGGTLALHATNLSMAATQDATAIVEAPGATCVPADKFAALVNSLPKGAQIELETTERKLAVRYGRGRASFTTWDAADFPAMKPPGEAEPFAIDAAELHRIVSAVLPHAGDEQTRFYLCGVHLHGDETLLRAVATDGNSLALAVADVPCVFPPAILPSAACAALLRILASASGDVAVAITATDFRAEIGTCTFQSRLVDGTFPDYTRVIPARVPKPIEIESGTLAEIVRRCQVVTGAADATKAQPRSVILHAKGSTLRLEAGSEIDQKIDETVFIYELPEPRRIVLGTSYVLDGIASLGDGLLELHVAGELEPLLMRRAGASEELVVVMPRRG